MINRWPTFLIVALALLSAPSCTTTAHKPEGPDAKAPPERDVARLANKYHISPGGETIPPPADVASREKSSNSADDKTLVLMADIATAQDKIQEHLKKVDEQLVTFVQPTRMPELEKKIGSLQKQIEAVNAQLEGRIASLEQHVVKPSPDTYAQSTIKNDEAPVPAKEPVAAPVVASNAPIILPEPPPLPAVAPTPQAPKPSSIGVLDRFLAEPTISGKPVAKFSQFAQELRQNVRDAYNKVITSYPNADATLDAYIGLAGLAEQDENWSDTARCYREAMERFPNAPAAAEVRFGLANALQQLGEFADARKNFLAIADNYPRYQKVSMALVNAADCLAKSGKSADALKEYQAIERSRENTPLGRLALERIGDVLTSMKNFKEAADCYARAYSSDDEVPEVIMKLARSQVARGDFVAARSALQKLLAPGRNDEIRAAARFGIASTYEEEGDFLNAAREYASGADMFPAIPFALEARMKCAQLFLSLEMPDHALAQCDQLLGALKNSPYKTRLDLEPQALHTTVKGSRLTSNPEKLQSGLTQLRREWPDSPQAQDAELDEADCLDQTGKSAEAIAALRELVRRHPNTPMAAQAILKIADIQERSKNTKRGISLYAELAALTSDADRAVQLRLRRALLLEDAGRSDEAVALLKEVAGDHRISPSALGMAEYQIALIDQKRSRLDDAISGYERLIARSKDLPNNQLSDLLEDARWKVSKLKWLSNLQKQQELTVQPEPAKKAQPAEKRS